MKNHLSVAALLFSLVTNAQLSSILGPKKKPVPDTLNFTALNAAMHKQELVIDGYPFSFLKLTDTALYRVYKGPYSEERKKQYESLDHDIHYVDVMVSNFADSYVRPAGGDFHLVSQIETAVGKLKEGHPHLDISGYESLYHFCAWVEQRHKAVEDSLAEVANQSHIRQRAIDDSLHRESETRWAAYQKQQDDLYAARQKKEDSIQQARIKKETREYRKECIRQFGPQNGAIIADGKVKLGFTEDMCEMAWGSTDYNTYNTYTKEGTVVRRVYKSGKVLTFKKGILVAITE